MISNSRFILNGETPLTSPVDMAKHRAKNPKTGEMYYEYYSFIWLHYITIHLTKYGTWLASFIVNGYFNSTFYFIHKTL